MWNFLSRDPLRSSSACYSLTKVVSSFGMYWDYWLVTLFFGIAVPILGRRRIRKLLALPDTTKSDRLRLYTSTIIFQWIAAMFIYVRSGKHGLSASTLGLTYGIAWPRTAGVAILLSTLVIANQLLSLRALPQHPEAAKGHLQQVALKIFPRDAGERAMFFVLVVTVAVCEEFIFRGFFQPLFTALAGVSLAVGILGSAVMFGVSHLYQGRRGLITTFVIGLLFSGVTAWTGSLLPSVVAHFFTDILAGFVAPRKIREALNSSG